MYDTYIAKLTSEPQVETSGGDAVKPQLKEQRLRHVGITRSDSSKSSEGRDVTDGKTPAPSIVHATQLQALVVNRT